MDDDHLELCRPTLIAAIKELEQSMRAINAQIISEMTEKLKSFTLSAST